MSTPDANEPAACGQGADDVEVSRRSFFSMLCYAMGGVATLAIGAPLTAFVVSPLWESAPSFWRDVGVVDDFAPGTTTEVTYEDATSLPWAGVSARTAAWLRRERGETFVAFSVNCTHLGCPVRWLAEAKLFMCPCHGGVYYASGDVAAGPPPHPLPRYAVQVVTKDYKRDDGTLLRNARVVQVLASPVPITTT